MLYIIRPLLKMLLLSVPALGVLFVTFNIFRNKQSIKLVEVVKKCKKRFPFILAAAFVCGVFCMLYLWSGEPYSENFKMSYTYPMASKGLTPNSTMLDVSEIFSDEVLERALQTGLLEDLTPEEIRDTLEISQVKQRKGVSIGDLYVSTEYAISYNASKRTIKLDKEALLKVITDTYYEYFITKYKRKTDVLENDYSQVLGLDYLDVSTYLQEQSGIIIEYMEMCRRDNETFISEVTNESFISVKDRVRNFQDVSLERYKAYILKYGISKDREQYVSRLNYENRLENMSYMKNLASYGVRLAAIDRYEGDITRAVLVPTRDQTGEFYQSRTKIGTDYFANEADQYLKYATDNQLNIETNNYYIESLSGAAGGIEHRKKADGMVESLKEELAYISNLAVETVKDYDAQTSNGYISFAFQDREDFRLSCMKKTALYVIGSVIIWCAAVFTGSKFEIKIRKRRGDLKNG